MASEAEKASVEVEKHEEIEKQAVAEEKPLSFVERVKARVSRSVEKESEQSEQMHQDVYAARKKVTELGEKPIVKKIAAAEQQFSEEYTKKERGGLTGFVFGRTRKPPLARSFKGKAMRESRAPSYVQQQVQRPYRYYGFQRRVGPQSGAPVRLPQRGYSDGMPQNWGPTHDYRVASSLHLFGEWGGANGLQSPIAKYGGNLPRFWDSKPKQARQLVGVNAKRGMFKRGVFG
jgi:hypothetical protein